MVKTYTELHGGNVQLSSEENKGTTITLTLPVIAMEQSAVEVSPETVSSDIESVAAGVEVVVPDTDMPAPDAPLLLIVDDTPEISEFIYQILHTKYRCRLADNGKKGMELTLELMPDLIIADIMMPVMDGLEWCVISKSMFPHPPFPSSY